MAMMTADSSRTKKAKQLKWVASLNKNACEKGIRRSSCKAEAVDILTSKKRGWTDLRHEEGLTGFFTKEEDNILRAHLEDYFKSIGSTWEDGIKSLVEHENRRRTKEGSIWRQIAQALPNRRVSSVMFRVQSQLYPWIKGKWTDAENEKLIELYDGTPGDWKRIGFALQRYWRTASDHFKALESTGKVEKIRAVLKNRSSEQPPEKSENLCYTKSKLRWWTASEDEKLLDCIRQITGVQWPLTQIPWEHIHLSLKADIPHRSRTELRSRYVKNLIPHKEFSKLGNALVRRQLLRFLMKILEQQPDLHWSEIEWSVSLPYWPGLRNGWLAKQMILEEIGYGAVYRYKHSNDKVRKFFDKPKWKAVVQSMAKRLLVNQYMKQDIVELELLLSRLRESNGGNAENWGHIPYEGDVAARQNYTKKRRKILSLTKEDELTEKLLKLDPAVFGGRSLAESPNVSGLEDISFL